MMNITCSWICFVFCKKEHIAKRLSLVAPDFNPGSKATTQIAPQSGAALILSISFVANAPNHNMFRFCSAPFGAQTWFALPPR